MLDATKLNGTSVSSKSPGRANKYSLAISIKQQQQPAGMQQLQWHGEKRVGKSGHETEALADPPTAPIPHPNRRPRGDNPS
jgi:hypothetical protein